MAFFAAFYNNFIIVMLTGVTSHLRHTNPVIILIYDRYSIVNLSVTIVYAFMCVRVCVCVCYLCLINGILTQFAAATAAKGTKRPMRVGRFYVKTIQLT